MMTSRQVGCGCTVRLFTTLGECGLSLSGLRPIKTHNSNYKMRNNQGVLGVPGMGVKDLNGCKRPEWV